MRVDDDDEEYNNDEADVLKKELKPSLSLTTKPPSIFSVSSILADKKTQTQRRRAGGVQGRCSVLT